MQDTIGLQAAETSIWEASLRQSINIRLAGVFRLPQRLVELTKQAASRSSKLLNYRMQLKV
jgi:hypothetical protein